LPELLYTFKAPKGFFPLAKRKRRISKKKLSLPQFIPMVTKIIFIKQQILNIFIQKYLQQYSLFLFILFLVKIPENGQILD